MTRQIKCCEPPVVGPRLSLPWLEIRRRDPDDRRHPLDSRFERTLGYIEQRFDGSFEVWCIDEFGEELSRCPDLEALPLGKMVRRLRQVIEARCGDLKLEVV